MRLSRVMVSAAALLAQSFLVQSIFLPWSKFKNDSSDGLYIARTMIEFSKRVNNFGGKQLEKFKNITRRVSLDERCFDDNDMPLSIAFHKNLPYVFFAAGKRSIHIQGMFPSLLSDILDYCCPGGAKKVRFGKFLRTPLEAEDRFLNKNVNEYDFTFPIHAPAGSRSFRDHPFIPLVRVPSVVFLAYDGNKRTSKTHDIAATILKAWPIMVFIFLTAAFSGIIIWFLVSANDAKIFLNMLKCLL